MIWVGVFTLYLNEGNILSFGDNLSEGSIIKTNPNLISRMLPLKATIGIPIRISYVTKLQHVKFGLWIVTSNLKHLHGRICQINFRPSTTIVDIEVTFMGKFEGSWKLGVKLPLSSFLLIFIFYWSNLQSWIHVTLANIWWNINKKKIGNWIHRDLVMVIQSAHLFIPYLNTCPPNYVHN